MTTAMPATESPIYVQAMFGEMDAGFIGFSETDVSFSWKCSEMLVQWVWELMVPVQIRYQFGTHDYDISFGIELIGEDEGVTVLREFERVNSHVEPVVGRCTVKAKGSVRLVWDNTFSWFTPKTLTYTVALTLPEFSIAEESRRNRARSTLHKAVDDIQRAELRLERSKQVHKLHLEQLSSHSRATVQTAQSLTTEIDLITAQLQQLQLQLERKGRALETAQNETHELQRRLVAERSCVPGLCIRFLDRRLLKIVFKYSESSQIDNVCKYWRAINTRTHANSERR